MGAQPIRIPNIGNSGLTVNSRFRNLREYRVEPFLVSAFDTTTMKMLESVSILPRRQINEGFNVQGQEKDG